MSLVATRAPTWRELGVGLAGSLAAAAAISLSGLTGATSFLGVMTYLVGAGLVAWRWRHGPLGVANLVTLGRLVGTSAVTGLLLGQLLQGRSGRAVVAMVTVAAVCLVLDGVDGHLARSRGLATGFGARFDVEADAALLIVLSVAVAALQVAGWWVLAIGLVRYLYVLAAHWCPPLRTPLPPSLLRKVISVGLNVVLLISLACSLVPAIPGWAPTALLLLALAALGWSFGRDIVWQVRHRGR